MTYQNIKQYKKINNIVVIAIGVFVLAWVFFNLLFPVFKIDNDAKDDFSVRIINEIKYLELKIKGGHSFHKIFMKINVDKNNAGQRKFLGKIYQDELGLYAIGTTINSREELDKSLKIKENSNIVNGELIQKGNFVYFISENQYRAFANAETFDKLGFNWNKIQDNKELLLNNLIKGSIIDKTNSYLPSSFVEVDKKIYLLGIEKKHLINDQALEKYIRNKFSVIKIRNEKLQVVGKMECSNDWRNNQVCKFKDDLRKTLPQATIFIKLNENLPEKWFSKIYTFDKFKSLVPRKALSNIKRNLILKYDQRFGIGERVNK